MTLIKSHILSIIRKTTMPISALNQKTSISYNNFYDDN